MRKYLLKCAYVRKYASAQIHVRKYLLNYAIAQVHA